MVVAAEGLDDTVGADHVETDLKLRVIGRSSVQYADGAEDGDGGWQAQGFVRTSGVLPQTWALRLIRESGGTTSVERLPVDAAGRAHVQLAEGERGTLAVSGTTPFTTEPASYSLSTP